MQFYEMPEYEFAQKIKKILLNPKNLSAIFKWFVKVLVLPLLISFYHNI